MYPKTGVVYSGKNAQEHETGKIAFIAPQRLLMVRTQICLRTSQRRAFASLTATARRSGTMFVDRARVRKITIFFFLFPGLCDSGCESST